MCKPGPGDVIGVPAGREPGLVLEGGLVDTPSPRIHNLDEDSQSPNETGAVGKIRCDNMMECHDDQVNIFVCRS